MRSLWRSALLSLAVIIAVGIAAPFLRADRYRPKIEAALESALNRHVEIGAVRLNLFHGPGFTLEDVLIDDVPGAGIEPFAHVESLQARLKLTSLLSGRLAFSNLRLVEPSVNLAKGAGGSWNIAPLLAANGKGAPQHRHSLPDIEISSGRLNLKFGDTKSVFYISDADVEVYPDEAGNIVVRFSGQPSRTDRAAAQGFGRFSARGILRSTATGEDQFNLRFDLDRTSISDLTMLAFGHDIGVHGFATANATVAGRLSKLDIQGDLNMDDVHRWDLMPANGERWNLSLRGLLDLPAQQLEIETTPVSLHPLPVSVKFRVNNYLSTPKWAAFITVRDLAASSFIQAARHMGAPLPDGIQVDGMVQGAVGYSRESGIQGTLSIASGSVKLAQNSTAEFDALPLMISGNRVSFGPAAVRLGNSETAQVEGYYALDSRAAGLKLDTNQLTIAEVESGANRLLDASPIPVIERLRQGVFRGWIAFDRRDDNAGVWTGNYELRNATLDLSGVGAPLRLASAAVNMQAGEIRVSHFRGRVADVKLEGSYSFSPSEMLPHTLHLSIPELQLLEVDRLMRPALGRPEGFLARTFRFRRTPLPVWLKDRQLVGSVEIAKLMCGDVPLGALQAHLSWTGPRILFDDVQSQLDDMRASGTLAVNLTGSLPAYRFSGRIENMGYQSGTLDLDGDVETSGFESDLFANARSDGNFHGRDINLGPEAEMSAISGVYHLAPTPNLPRLQLRDLEVTQGDETLNGQGVSQSDGQIVLELTSGRKQVRLTGMLFPTHADPATSR